MLLLCLFATVFALPLQTARAREYCDKFATGMCYIPYVTAFAGIEILNVISVARKPMLYKKMCDLANAEVDYRPKPTNGSNFLRYIFNHEELDKRLFQ